MFAEERRRKRGGKRLSAPLYRFLFSRGIVPRERTPPPPTPAALLRHVFGDTVECNGDFGLCGFYFVFQFFFGVSHFGFSLRPLLVTWRSFDNACDKAKLFPRHCFSVHFHAPKHIAHCGKKQKLSTIRRSFDNANATRVINRGHDIWKYIQRKIPNENCVAQLCCVMHQTLSLAAASG